MSQRLLLLLAVASASLFCALFAFSPGFDNGFYLDDFVLLQRCQDARTDPGVVLDRWVEPFNRPLSQAAFYLEYRFWGLDSGRYIITNTLLHVANAALLFWLFQAPLGPPVAAAAALLFALGFGFYGKALLWAANLPDLLATTFVLLTGIVAHKGQLARLASQRAAWMGLAGVLFALALASKESGLMAIFMVAGLIWPHRRSVGSVVRKIGVLVVIAGTYLFLQVLAGSGVARLAQDPTAWLAMPMRALRLATLMFVPVLQDSPLLASANPILARSGALLDQVRPILGLALLAVAVVFFIRGSGAVRWLLASFLAFLLPFGLIHMPGTWLDVRYTYLPATCYCGLAALVLRSLWQTRHGIARAMVVVGLFVVLYADLTLVRLLERKYDGFGRSPESQAALHALEERQGSP